VKFTKEFFDTLGTYVYVYADPETNEPYYVGKGKGDRCIQHVRDKGYDSAHCRLVAKNLERFSEENPDAIAFAIESFIISQNPNLDNKVSGHYKECFTMPDINVDSLFDNYVSSKTTGRQHLCQTLEDYPDFDKYFDLSGELRSTPGQWRAASSMNDSLYAIIVKEVKDEHFKFRLERTEYTNDEGEKIKPTKEIHYNLGVKMTKNFTDANVELVEHANADDGVLFSSAKTYVEFFVPNLEDAIEAFMKVANKK
jgi:hypothetical protein